MISQANKPHFDNEAEEKLQYAEMLLHNPTNPYEVAQSLYPNDLGTCMWIVNFWVKDPIVTEKQKELLAEYGEEYFLPSKVDTARDIWNRAKACHDPDQYSKLMRLYADVRGFIEKAAINVDART